MADYSLSYSAAEVDLLLGRASSAAQTSAKYTMALSAASWSDNTYTLAVTGATADNVVELTPAPSITADQVEALQAANIIGTAQSTDSITLTAFGDVPTIDIPIIVIVRGDM